MSARSSATTKQAMHEIDPALPLYNAQSVTQIIEQSMGQPQAEHEFYWRSSLSWRGWCLQ